MSRKALIAVDVGDGWDPLIDGDILQMLKENEEGNGIKVTSLSMLNEACIMDILMRHGELLTCFNCGKRLTETEGSRIHKHGKDRLIAKLILEPGEVNYPREPDIPASLYFVCAECSGENTQTE
ncbi:MAG: hypothetical protein FIB08_01425 [Candidatus Methanoperedens sp.]|nr:hypothetical protein [Candidatus Methanoperedens sp.]